MEKDKTEETRSAIVGVNNFDDLGETGGSELKIGKARERGVIQTTATSWGENGERLNGVSGMLEDLGRRRREQLQSLKQCSSHQQDELEEECMLEAEVDQHPDSDDMTAIADIVLESNLVIYGPGLQIHQITPGYDLCQIFLQVPIGTTRTTIMEMLLKQGLSISDFHILRLEEMKKMIEVIIITTIQFGRRLERNRFAFKNRKVTFHVRRDAIWTSGSMKGVQPSLTLTWDSSPNKSSRRFSADIALASVYDRIFDTQGAQMETCCVLTPETGSTPNQVMLTVDFDDWDNALKAVHNFQENRPEGIPSFVATTPLHQWSIAIPLSQFEAQTGRWLELSETQNKEAQIKIKITNKNVIIYVHGGDMASAGALKVRVEKLARGEVLEGIYWHPSFANPEESTKLLGNISQTAQVHLSCHQVARTLVAYGESEKVDAARKMIKAEVDRREQVMTKTTLPDASDDFFVRGGFEKIKELVGEENVEWRITSRWSLIRMRGGEEATHHLRRLIKESLVARPNFHNETTCPVCFTDTLYPEMLECGHGYCSGCINLFLKAAADNKKFPIACVGEDATCNVPIALPFIRRFLPHYTFKHLLESAFAAYLEQNPTQFRYCKTPDCRQTYRRQPADRGASITCPSCFAKTCSSCSEDHENLTCEEYRIYRDPGEQERLNVELANTHGYKRCPRCAVWVEKTGGCNHMSCKCGAHICWICLGIFDAGEIYNHIATH